MGLDYYNAAVDLIARNLTAERAHKTAVIDESGSHTYAELAERVDRCANALRELGVEPEQRVLLCLHDSIDFPACFLGAIKAGIIPIPSNTMWSASDYAFALSDSRAKAVIVSEARLQAIDMGAQICGWKGQIVVAGTSEGRYPELSRLMNAAAASCETYPTQSDDACFWLYSSGSTGRPKGAVHVQTSLIKTAELYGQGVLGISAGDVIFSAAKLFFAYGLGNALTFPFSVGATAVLFAGRPKPEIINSILREYRPTLFFAVPTQFSALLASADLPRRGEHNLRLCGSAGEALPEPVATAWTKHTGVEIIDGMGSTEMLHCFLSNRPGAVRYGTSGLPVPGYRVRLVDENGAEVRRGKIGELQVNGPTTAAYYWNNREKTRTTFLGEWMRTGDKFRQDEDGYLIHCGRSDEMLKVSGVWVSPIEVESALISHDAVSEAAVIATVDKHGLVKPKAFVMLNAGFVADDGMRRELQQFVKARLAPYKYPRYIEFVNELPKTATGKLQRFLLVRREKERQQQERQEG
ncbi:MAG: benzoate-CoA ligase family protein [Candidatus Korobacteraceae bacterium]